MPAINPDRLDAPYAINAEKEDVAKPIDSAGKESGAGRSGNRRSREDYNAYMREYMRKRRASG